MHQLSGDLGRLEEFASIMSWKNACISMKMVNIVVNGVIILLMLLVILLGGSWQHIRLCSSCVESVFVGGC
jgi:hypothetical protein